MPTQIWDASAISRTRRMLPTGRSMTLSALIVLGLGCCATFATFQTHATGASPAPATERDGQHDFDFIFGRWKIHLKRRVPAATGSDTWTEFDGYGLYRKVWDGRANLNEFEADSPTGHVQGLTLRTYNPQTHQWSLYWASSQDGVLDIPQIGQFRNGQGEFTPRIRWTVRPSSFAMCGRTTGRVRPTSSRLSPPMAARAGMSTGSQTWCAYPMTLTVARGQSE
jgi:hypothetical protein